MAYLESEPVQASLDLLRKNLPVNQSFLSNTIGFPLSQYEFTIITEAVLASTPVGEICFRHDSGIRKEIACYSGIVFEVMIGQGSEYSAYLPPTLSK